MFSKLNATIIKVSVASVLKPGAMLLEVADRLVEHVEWKVRFAENIQPRHNYTQHKKSEYRYIQLIT